MNKIQFMVSKYQMPNIFIKIVTLTIILFVFYSPIFSQDLRNQEDCACSKNDKTKVQEYFKNLEKQNQFIAECVRKTSNPLAKKISHLNIQAISLVKPFYPKIAKELNMFGSVNVVIIFDKEGKVIYAKAIDGKMFFRYVAEKAACLSLFQPVQYCGSKVMQKRVIRYNFIL